MRDKGSYRDLLGERIENAYREKGDISKPTEIQMAKWKQIAKMRRREKIRRRKIIASLASVFAMVFCVGMVSMFQIPDAEAGRDGIVDIKDPENDEIMITKVFESQDDLPRDISEEFLIFEDLPKGYELSEIKIISTGNKRRYEGQFTFNGENAFLLKQTNNVGEGKLEAIVLNSDSIEKWSGMDVYIKEYTNNDQQILYSLVSDKTVITIMSNKNVEKNIIKNIIEEAIN